MAISTEAANRCPRCGRQFKNEAGLAGHMLWKHGQGSTRKKSPRFVTELDLMRQFAQADQTQREAILSLSERLNTLLKELGEVQSVLHKRIDRLERVLADKEAGCK